MGKSLTRVFASRQKIWKYGLNFDITGRVPITSFFSSFGIGDITFCLYTSSR